jgi:hypothetical protein
MGQIKYTCSFCWTAYYNKPTDSFCPYSSSYSVSKHCIGHYDTAFSNPSPHPSRIETTKSINTPWEGWCVLRRRKGRLTRRAYKGSSCWWKYLVRRGNVHGHALRILTLIGKVIKHGSYSYSDNFSTSGQGCSNAIPLKRVTDKLTVPKVPVFYETPKTLFTRAHDWILLWTLRTQFTL